MNELKSVLIEISTEKVEGFQSLFTNDALFKPFMRVLCDIIKKYNITYDSFNINEWFSNELIKGLQKSEYKDKIKPIELKEIDGDVKMFNQFKDGIEIIQDDKN